MVEEVLDYLRCKESDDEESEAGEGRSAESRSHIYVDGTLGTAGHTLAILRSNEKNLVIAFDRDAESMQWARRRLEDEGLLHRVAMVQSDFRFAPLALEKLQEEIGAHAEGNTEASALNLENSKVDESAESPETPSPRVVHVGSEFAKRKGASLIGDIDGALIDAGMSMFQVAWGERGLSFNTDAPLDMRYNRQHRVSAADLINQLSPQELEDLFFKFTDERWARRIALTITEHRRRNAVHTTSELVSLIEAAIPVGVRRSMRVHPATRVFAALRLAVNDEFWAIEHGVWALSTVLANAARLIVLTYSSNEDRTAKRTYRRLAKNADSRQTDESRQEAFALSTQRKFSSARPPLTNYPDFSLDLPAEQDDLQPPDYLKPYLTDFGKTWRMKIVTNKPVEPSDEEIVSNPLSRSCKLRAVERLAVPAGS